jgi:hypothetical protein
MLESLLEPNTTVHGVPVARFEPASTSPKSVTSAVPLAQAAAEMFVAEGTVAPTTELLVAPGAEVAEPAIAATMTAAPTIDDHARLRARFAPVIDGHLGGASASGADCCTASPCRTFPRRSRFVHGTFTQTG